MSSPTRSSSQRTWKIRASKDCPVEPIRPLAPLRGEPSCSGTLNPAAGTKGKSSQLPQQKFGGLRPAPPIEGIEGSQVSTRGTRRLTGGKPWPLAPRSTAIAETTILTVRAYLTRGRRGTLPPPPFLFPLSFLGKERGPPPGRRPPRRAASPEAARRLRTPLR